LADFETELSNIDNRVPMAGTQDPLPDTNVENYGPVSDGNTELEEKVLKIIKDDIDSGKRANEAERDSRVKHYDIYRAKGDGKLDRPGRSRLKSSDTMDAIEWMMPSFMKTFAGSNTCVSVAPVGVEDVGKAEKLQKLLNWQFMGNEVNGFCVLYEWIKSSLIYGTSVIKVSWKDDYVKEGFDMPLASDAQIQQMMGDDNYLDVEGSPEDIQPGMILSQDVLNMAAGNEEMLQKIGQANSQTSGTQPIAIAPMRVWREVKGKKRIKVYSGPMVEVISPEDFYIDPEATSLKNAQFVIHRVWRTFGNLRELEQDGIYKNVDKVKEYADKNREEFSAQSEQSERYAAAGMVNPAVNSVYGAEEQLARKKMEVFEWWGLLDVDGEGYQEPYLVVVCGDTVLRMEKNPYGHGKPPFEVLRPMLDPFKFSGVGMPELVGEFQELKTALMRQTLDNISFQNNGMWLVNRNAGIDMNALLHPRPGTIVRTNMVGNAVVPLTPNSLQSMPLTMINLVDSMMEKRTGVTSYNQGLDANSLNKMLALDTPIPMADGSVKLNKDIVSGDMVIGSDGTPTKVIDAHPVQMPKRAFKIVFENGDIIRAGGEHLWTVSIREGKKTYSDMEILPTERIYEILSDGHHTAVIPRVKAVEYADKKLILDPYILGAWLGDGHSHTNRITSMDSEIIDRFKDWANQFYAGEVVPCKQSNSGKATTYKIINTPFREMLKDLKCLKDTRYDDTKNNEKHIPEEYFTASKAQRLELLRGLMDTDGCRYKFKGKLSASAVYCTSSERLRDDVCRLIDSLGGIAKITHTTPCERTSGRHYKTHWHISFTMEECPFYIKRKADKWNPGKCADRNHIVYIEEIDVEPMRCLSVAAADRMYCCGKHFTVTRNTATGITKIMNASAQRIELIARIMAETGIKPLYQKLLQLDQQFIDQTMVIRVFNQPLQISPDDLAGNFDVTVDVGGATGKDEQRAQQMMMLIQYAANLMQLGVMRPENVYQICQQLMMVWGWKDYDRYLTNPQEADKLKQCLQIINQLNQNAQMAAKQGQQIPTQPIVQAFQQIYQLIDQVVGAHAQQNMSMTGSPSNEQMAAIGGGNNAGQYSATAIQGRSANGVVPGAA
jgi:hypothetical protein